MLMMILRMRGDDLEGSKLVGPMFLNWTDALKFHNVEVQEYGEAMDCCAQTRKILRLVE